MSRISIALCFSFYAMFLGTSFAETVNIGTGKSITKKLSGQSKFSRHRKTINLNKDKKLKRKICRTAIATLMGRDLKIVKTRRSKSNLVYVSYKRKSDRKLFQYDCKIVGNRVVWRGFNIWGQKQAGHWRTHEKDEQIIYSIYNNTLSISVSYLDGSFRTKNYKFKG